jgi:hypothetical protein
LQSAVAALSLTTLSAAQVSVERLNCKSWHQAEPVSKTTPFRYRGQLFWVYDLWESFLFAEMADIAAQLPKRERTPWLAGLSGICA